MTHPAPSSDYADAADRLFSDLADPVARVSAGAAAPSIWGALEEMMFPAAWVTEDRGGAGLNAVEVGQIVESAGRHAVAEPLVDTLLARHWASRAGLDVPEDGPIGFAPKTLGERAELDAEGCIVGHLGAAQGPRVVLGDTDGVATLSLVDTGETMPRATARLNVAPLVVRSSAAALAAAQIAGSVRGMLTLTVTYAGEREAFGRTISRFQAGQHHIAQLATEVAAAELAARVALKAIDDGHGIFEAAAAKIRADEAGRAGARIAHQVFGAIGFTIEHPLHLFTSSVEHWRGAYGTGPEWAVHLGRAALAQGGGALWPGITAPEQLSAAMIGAPHA